MKKKYNVIILSAIAAVLLLSATALLNREALDYHSSEKAPELANLNFNKSQLEFQKLENLTSSNSSSGSTSSENYMYVTGVENSISLKETDSSDSKTLTTLLVGMRVVFIDDSSFDYYYVDYNGTSGYIKKEYLTNEMSAVCKRADAYIARTTPLYDTNNDTNKKQIATLERNNGVFIVAKYSGDYWYVYSKSNKKFGYVKVFDISLEKASDDTENVTSRVDISSAGISPSYGEAYYAKIDTGYLAIRSAKLYDSANELGKLNTGDPVYAIDKSDDTYWYCYAPMLGIYGYVDSRYLVTESPNSSSDSTDTDTDTDSDRASGDYTVWYVGGFSGNSYLALRSSKAYTSSNEIGKLYTNDEVYVYDDDYESYNETYWYVYAPSLGKFGYVNSNYIWDDKDEFASSDTDVEVMYVNSWHVTGNDAVLRKAPCDDDNVIMNLTNGEELIIPENAYAFETDRFWYVGVSPNEVYGYLDKEYIAEPW